MSKCILVNKIKKVRNSPFDDESGRSPRARLPGLMQRKDYPNTQSCYTIFQLIDDGGEEKMLMNKDTECN